MRMPTSKVPVPTTMPVDKSKWLSELHLSNFHNAFYQYRDVRACIGNRGKILIVGPGQGLDLAVFRSQGYEVTTYDIDVDFKPDHLGSVHEMDCFADGQFDVVIASHVLEHMSYSLLDPALRELSRVARHALVYLPYAGRHIDIFIHPVPERGRAPPADQRDTFLAPPIPREAALRRRSALLGDRRPRLLGGCDPTSNGEALRRSRCLSKPALACEHEFCAALAIPTRMRPV